MVSPMKRKRAGAPVARPIGIDTIEACIKISLHATAMQLRERHTMVNRYNDTVRGPWPHNTPDLLGW